MTVRDMISMVASKWGEMFLSSTFDKETKSNCHDHEMNIDCVINENALSMIVVVMYLVWLVVITIF